MIEILLDYLLSVVTNIFKLHLNIYFLGHATYISIQISHDDITPAKFSYLKDLKSSWIRGSAQVTSDKWYVFLPRENGENNLLTFFWF